MAIAIGRLSPRVAAHSEPSKRIDIVLFFGIRFLAFIKVTTATGPNMTQKGTTILVTIVWERATLPAASDLPCSNPLLSFILMPFSSSLYLMRPTLAAFASDTAIQLKNALAMNCLVPVILLVAPENSLLKERAMVKEVTTAPEYPLMISTSLTIELTC